MEWEAVGLPRQVSLPQGHFFAMRKDNRMAQGVDRPTPTSTRNNTSGCYANRPRTMSQIVIPSGAPQARSRRNLGLCVYLSKTSTLGNRGSISMNMHCRKSSAVHCFPACGSCPHLSPGFLRLRRFAPSLGMTTRCVVFETHMIHANTRVRAIITSLTNGTKGSHAR